MLVSQLLEVVVRLVDPITLKLLYTPRVRLWQLRIWAAKASLLLLRSKSFLIPETGF